MIWLRSRKVVMLTLVKTNSYLWARPAFETSLQGSPLMWLKPHCFKVLFDAASLGSNPANNCSSVLEAPVSWLFLSFGWLCDRWSNSISCTEAKIFLYACLCNVHDAWRYILRPSVDGRFSRSGFQRDPPTNSRCSSRLRCEACMAIEWYLSKYAAWWDVFSRSVLQRPFFCSKV